MLFFLKIHVVGLYVGCFVRVRLIEVIKYRLNLVVGTVKSRLIIVDIGRKVFLSLPL